MSKPKPSRAVRDLENLIRSVHPGADVMSLKSILYKIVQELKAERGELKR